MTTISDDTAEARPAQGGRLRALDARLVEIVHKPALWVPWLIAAVPAFWMAWFVLQGSHLPYNDYWDMMPRSVTPSGGLDLGGVFTFQNEHPVIIPQILFWLNVHLSGGSNIWLGLVVVAIVFAQVVLLACLVERDDRNTWAAGSLIVVASVLLFSQQGVHNFSKSMSGIAWLGANLFVVAAILACYRRRTWLAGGLGVVASAFYVTGLAVWPALVVVGMVRDRRWIPDWRLLVVGAIPVVYYLAERPPSNEVVKPTVGRVAESALAVGSSIFTTDIGVMKVLTGLGLVIGLSLSLYAIWRGQTSATPWIAVWVYGVTSVVMISYGRILFLNQTIPSRYASLAAMFWIGVAGLVVVTVRWRWYGVIPSAALVVAAVAWTSPAVQEQRDLWLKQEDLAAAIVLGLETDTNAFSYAFRPAKELAPLLEDLGHYPFTSTYDGDCGLLGDTVDGDDVRRPKGGKIEKVRATTGKDGVRIIAKRPAKPKDVDCVVVIDEDDQVVGIGTLGLGHQTTFVGMSTGAEDPERLVAMAPAGPSSYRVLLVRDDGGLVQVGKTIEAESVKGL